MIVSCHSCRLAILGGIFIVVLDVGCGSRYKGDVNTDIFRGGWNRQESDQERGEFVDPHKIQNFVVASAEALPFRENCFDVVLSSHTIEHVSNPFRMLAELVRVTKRKVIIKCPHRLGSGARRPFHVNYFDEEWFIKSALALGVYVKAFVSGADDAAITQRVFQITPKPLKRLFDRNIPYRAARKVERKLFVKLKLPWEIEAHLTKKEAVDFGGVVGCKDLLFIVVSNDLGVYARCFRQGKGIMGFQVISFNNEQNVGLGGVYNAFAKFFMDRDVWLVFCHQDFVLNESLASKLVGLNKLGVYGVIGCRLGSLDFVGEIIQTDGSKFGRRLIEPEYVDTLDEVCLIVHTDSFRHGLRFDERFTFHYYGADLCLSASRLGFDVMAIQTDSQHKSRSLSGAVNSETYRDMQNKFREKWRALLPIRTTTGILK